MFIYLSKKVSASTLLCRLGFLSSTRINYYKCSLFDILIDCHSQQYPAKMCLLEQKSRFYFLRRRRWSSQSSQTRNSNRWTHFSKPPTCNLFLKLRLDTHSLWLKKTTTKNTNAKIITLLYDKISITRPLEERWFSLISDDARLKGLAAPSNLSMNQTLEGHSGEFH